MRGRGWRGNKGEMEKVEDLGGREGVTRGEESLVSHPPPLCLLPSLFTACVCVSTQWSAEAAGCLARVWPRGAPRGSAPTGGFLCFVPPHAHGNALLLFFLIGARRFCNTSLSPACCLRGQLTPIVVCCSRAHFLSPFLLANANHTACIRCMCDSPVFEPLARSGALQWYSEGKWKIME